MKEKRTKKTVLNQSNNCWCNTKINRNLDKRNGKGDRNIILANNSGKINTKWNDNETGFHSCPFLFEWFDENSNSEILLILFSWNFDQSLEMPPRWTHTGNPFPIIRNDMYNCTLHRNREKNKKSCAGINHIIGHSSARQKFLFYLTVSCVQVYWPYVCVCVWYTWVSLLLANKKFFLQALYWLYFYIKEVVLETCQGVDRISLSPHRIVCASLLLFFFCLLCVVFAVRRYFVITSNGSCAVFFFSSFPTRTFSSTLRLVYPVTLLACFVLLLSLSFTLLVRLVCN